jgi:hypothetical protein
MVKVAFSFPPEIARNPRVRSALLDAGNFVRDLWLARAPYSSGDYARGLMHAGSVKLTGNKLEITNTCPHAAVVEFGFRSYNIGLAILNSGKGVRMSAEGFRYKVIKIGDTAKARYRQASVAQAVQKSYAKLAPIGLSNPNFKFGAYKPRMSLQKPLKPGAVRGTSQVLTISEKAIKQNPDKWRMPSRDGKKLGERIQKEGAVIIKDVVRRIIAQERDRQKRLYGKKPRWFKPSMARAPLKQVPVSRGSK